MKKISILITILFIFAAFPMMAIAEDTYVDIDVFTGEAVSGDLSSVDNIPVSYDCIYNRTQDRYRYTFVNMGTVEVQSNVANGMVTQSPVAINIPEGATPSLYLDGVLLQNVDYSNITSTGQYTLSLNMNGTDMRNVLGFTIIGPYCGFINSIAVPDGFEFVSIYVNGLPAESFNTMINLEEEGEYNITYKCTATQKTYTLLTTVDHTAPTLKLDGVNEKNIATGPVSLADLEPGAELMVYLNDELVGTNLTELKASGQYLLILTDAAGNTTNYNFQIRLYLDLNSWILIFIIVLLIAGLAVYIIFSRKHLRVR